MHMPWKDLQILTLRYCWTKDNWFRDFLVKHGSTLKMITCEWVELTPCNGTVRRSDLLNLQNSTSWWQKFEAMLTMPRLKKVVLRGLEFLHKRDGSTPPNPENTEPETDRGWNRQNAGGADAMTMENGDIAAVLGRTLQDRASVYERKGKVFDQHKIWFFEAV
jgi:hypothetical protein